MNMCFLQILFYGKVVYHSFTGKTTKRRSNLFVVCNRGDLERIADTVDDILQRGAAVDLDQVTRAANGLDCARTIRVRAIFATLHFIDHALDVFVVRTEAREEALDHSFRQLRLVDVSNFDGNFELLEPSCKRETELVGGIAVVQLNTDASTDVFKLLAFVLSRE